MKTASRALLAIVAVGAAAVVPAAAFASAPKSGTYHFKGDLTGTFVVRGQRVTGFHGRITSSAESACGTGTVAASEALTETHFVGENVDGGSYNLWGVGRNHSGGDPIYSPIKASFGHAGKRVTGSIDFGIAHGQGGDLYYDHGACDLQFTVSP